MSLRKQYEINPESEINGIAHEVATHDNGDVCVIFVARMARTSKKYAKALETASGPHRVAMSNGTMKTEKQDEIFMKVFASACIPGWKNMKKSDVTGNAADEGYIDYSPEAAYALIAALPDLYIDLQAVATKNENYLLANREVETKN